MDLSRHSGLGLLSFKAPCHCSVQHHSSRYWRSRDSTRAFGYVLQRLHWSTSLVAGDASRRARLGKYANSSVADEASQAALVSGSWCEESVGSWKYSCRPTAAILLGDGHFGSSA